MSIVDGHKTTQKRSQERREALLRSALELLEAGGTKAVTHRAVSRRAGLPSAAAGYYFKSVQELLEATLRFHIEERTRAIATLLEAAVTGASNTDEVATRIAWALVSGQSGIGVAQYEVYLEAARNERLRPEVKTAIATFERMAASLLDRLGAHDPTEAGIAFVAMLDGFALHRLAAPRPTDADRTTMERAIRGLFFVYAIDNQEFAHLRTRFRRPTSA